MGTPFLGNKFELAVWKIDQRRFGKLDFIKSAPATLYTFYISFKLDILNLTFFILIELDNVSIVTGSMIAITALIIAMKITGKFVY